MLTNNEAQQEQSEAHRIIELEKAMYAAGKLAFMPSRRRRPQCKHCEGKCKFFGRDRHGRQRYRCLDCKRTMFVAPVPRLLDGFHTSDLKIQMLIHLIAEGISLRGASRVVRLAGHTVHKIHKLVGQYCKEYMARTIVGIPASEVEVGGRRSFRSYQTGRRNRGRAR